jgi:hypothetical protein
MGDLINHDRSWSGFYYVNELIGMRGVRMNSPARTNVGVCDSLMPTHPENNNACGVALSHEYLHIMCVLCVFTSVVAVLVLVVAFVILLDLGTLFEASSSKSSVCSWAPQKCPE